MSRFTSQTQATLRGLIRKRGIGNSVRSALPDPHGAPVGTVNDPSELIGLHASTHIILKDCAAILSSKLPGFRWVLQPNEFGGVINLYCADFSMRWGYVIRYQDIMDDPRRRVVLKAARELLARFQYHGTRFDALAVVSVPRNREGEAIPLVSDKLRSRQTLRASIELAMAQGRARVVSQDGRGAVIEVKR